MSAKSGLSPRNSAPGHLPLVPQVDMGETVSRGAAPAPPMTVPHRAESVGIEQAPPRGNHGTGMSHPKASVPKVPGLKPNSNYGK